MTLKFNLMVAVCENMGIGKNNQLPWRLKSEMGYFTKMTTNTKDNTKKNVVIMGRKTWDAIIPKFKPLSNRINIVLSRKDLDVSQYKDTYSFKSLDDVIQKLNEDDFIKTYETIWVIGGSEIYKLTMESKYFHRLYITNILKSFDCDTFFPELGKNLKKISIPEVTEDTQEENGIKFVYNVYENSNGVN